MIENMAPLTYSAKLPYVLNLSNGIIGVSILAMPFCMKQCGLLFGTVVLCGAAILTRLSCNLLVKGAYFARSNSYESLALQTYGPLGKMAVETFLILYTKGTLIAFFVIIGDLGPVLLSDFIGFASTDQIKSDERETIRIVFMTVVALFVILPLSLQKNLGSLTRISSLAILFYGFLVMRILLQSLPSLFLSDWWNEVNWWRPSGFVQTLPIFALSLSCQTQLFVMASEMPDSSPVKMNSVVQSALTLCSTIYFMVGFFGYVAFHKHAIGGDVLVLLDSSGVTKLTKAGFLFSLAVSYPIMIFPCRAAVYSMLRRRQVTIIGGESSSDMHIPPMALKMITVYLIAFNLFVAIWIPDVELILALCGSLVGSLICFVMPGLLFQRVCPKNDTYARLSARICVAIGVFTLIFSTYVSLRDAGSSEHVKAVEPTFSDLSRMSALPQSVPLKMGEEYITQMPGNVPLSDAPAADKRLARDVQAYSLLKGRPSATERREKKEKGGQVEQIGGNSHFSGETNFTTSLR